MRIEDLM